MQIYFENYSKNTAFAEKIVIIINHLKYKGTKYMIGRKTKEAPPGIGRGFGIGVPEDF